jgi:malate dehydrogenase (oxaloacetate-decarboxylating)(NADP+)
MAKDSVQIKVKVYGGRFPRGLELLRDPVLNKGTAFSVEERDALGLHGLLPPGVSTIEQQEARVLENVRRQTNDLEKFIYLTALYDRNETLFFRVLRDNSEEFIPIVYTPTVGLACQMFGRIFQRPRGIFLSANDRGRMAEILGNWPYREEVRAIVVTDGERILGLGDLGANGMGIPVGKLTLYAVCGGVPPLQTLPIMFDAGTNNEALLADPLYIGTRRRRIRGAEYDALMEEFVTAVQTVFPHALLQFEDFANINAFRLLDTYRERVRCFNDDIQGTAAAAVAGLHAALRVTGGRLSDQRFLFLGAGEAALGICGLIVAALAQEGLSESEAQRRCWLVDTHGLVVDSRTDLPTHKRRYAHAHAPMQDLLAIVEAVRPTALIGVAAAAGAFTRPVLQAMARLNVRPIVFALSNPTSKAECTAEQAYAATDGRVVFASGSPFPPVKVNGHTFVPGQGNNLYIFPGVALGVIASRARRVTDEMFLVAARAVADLVSEVDIAQGRLYPPLAHIRDISAAIATRVAELAYARGLAERERPADLAAFVRGQMYEPGYQPYV